MKRISELLFSSKTMLLLLIILAIAMGTGTIIEDKYDTYTAKKMIYDSQWFELLFVFLALNFIGHIKSFNMLRKERIGGVIFHSAFVIMILGAGITRYFGFEGNMHIREGESSNILYSSEPSLFITAGGSKEKIEKEYPIQFSAYFNNEFQTKIESDTYGEIELKSLNFISNAEERVEENITGGKDIVELIVADEKGRERVFIESGEEKNIGSTSLSFEKNTKNSNLKIMQKEGMAYMTSSFEVLESNMSEGDKRILKKDSDFVLKNNYVYRTNGTAFLFSKLHKRGKIRIEKSENKDSGYNGVIFDLKIKEKHYELPFLFAEGQIANFHEYNSGGYKIKIAYGKKEIPLDFSLKLNHFILERYAGSESPSSYASEVTVIDKKNKNKKDFKIFMNHILEYGGFRFFQSSFDPDEKGTILSVNHDYWGTRVSYLGYILLSIGFIITLFNKKSRFLILRKMIMEVRKERKAISFILTILISFGTNVYAQTEKNTVIDRDHAERFGHLITQSMDGRFEPVHSLAFDILHKISRKDQFEIEGRGKMEAMQVFIEMMIDPEYWKAQKIIYIKEKSVKDYIEIQTNKASFNDFFDVEKKYKLQKAVDEAFRKKPSDQNNFDKEVIRTDERINVFLMVFQGSILKIFPESGSTNNKWISWDEDKASLPLNGIVNIINQDLKLPVFNYSNLMKAYMISAIDAKKTNDYTIANKTLNYVSKIQRQGISSDILPSEIKINAEIFYNNAQIFIVLKNLYSVLSILLLLFAFIENVRSKKSRLIQIILNTLMVILACGFLYQTFGMALRSYLLGYAPWSNGYEALILVSWGTLLAGFSFARYSKITLAATSLLAFFILMTAGHSSYDPQLTNLAPVLKSYWLIIHVAVLTISYGFLGLGFILGIMNLFIYLFKTKENNERLDLLIYELTYINEMNLTVGLLLATVGTFLGGVWANESWGRYWGWDAKETWALVIVITYTVLLHIRFIPKLSGKFSFNIGSIISFGSVLMTFFGVNYFLSKGMHSYGAGDQALFPLWAWITIIILIVLALSAWIKEKKINKLIEKNL